MKVSMDTYLLTWNPDKFAWDQLNDEAVALARGDVVESRWSCGNTKEVPVGSRVFMLRQGSKGRGIVGSGWVVRGTFQDPHWDPAKAKTGVMCNYVRIRLDGLLDPNAASILDVYSIGSGPLAQVYWPRPASGTRLEASAAAELELLWDQHTSGAGAGGAATDPELTAVEGAERIRLVKHRARERRLREAKIKAVMAATGGRLQCQVPGCGFDFEEKYGECGRGYAHVHHLKPLADFDGPVEVSLDDLAVVCANCHAMVHLGGSCRPLGTLVPQAS
jgi:5-methylcytosine-specific restriction enzyme A